MPIDAEILRWASREWPPLGSIEHPFNTRVVLPNQKVAVERWLPGDPLGPGGALTYQRWGSTTWENQDFTRRTDDEVPDIVWFDLIIDVPTLTHRPGVGRTGNTLYVPSDSPALSSERNVTARHQKHHLDRTRLHVITGLGLARCDTVLTNTNRSYSLLVGRLAASIKSKALGLSDAESTVAALRGLTRGQLRQVLPEPILSLAVHSQRVRNEIFDGAIFCLRQLYK